MPLAHPPGEAQVDFGHALARVNGRLRKVAFFVMAFERDCTETFWEGHVDRRLRFSAGWTIDPARFTAIVDGDRVAARSGFETTEAPSPVNNPSADALAASISPPEGEDDKMSFLMEDYTTIRRATARQSADYPSWFQAARPWPPDSTPSPTRRRWPKNSRFHVNWSHCIGCEKTGVRVETEIVPAAANSRRNFAERSRRRAWCSSS